MHFADIPEQARLVQRIAELKAEHRELDIAIAGVHASIASDELEVKRLKKRKLQLKDSIERLQSALIPDQPA